MEAMDAQIDGDEKLARFYTERFDEELKPAYEKWIALKPLENPAAPPHPFGPDSILRASIMRIARFSPRPTAAEAKAHTATITRASTSATRSCSPRCSFRGHRAGKFDPARVRWATLAFALALFLYAIGRMVMLPIA